MTGIEAGAISLGAAVVKSACKIWLGDRALAVDVTSVQYGRAWNGDDGSAPMPPAPDGLTDLPPILPWWGPQPRRAPVPPPDPPETGIRYRDLVN